MEYTPGEWRIHKPINCDYTVHTGKWGKGITQVAIVIESYPNAQANALLISASPNLYKACKKSLKLLMKSDLPMENMKAFDLLGDLERALDKADGKT